MVSFTDTATKSTCERKPFSHLFPFSAYVSLCMSIHWGRGNTFYYRNLKSCCNHLWRMLLHESGGKRVTAPFQIWWLNSTQSCYWASATEHWAPASLFPAFYLYSSNKTLTRSKLTGGGLFPCFTMWLWPPAELGNGRSSTSTVHMEYAGKFLITITAIRLFAITFLWILFVLIKLLLFLWIQNFGPTASKFGYIPPFYGN